MMDYLLEVKQQLRLHTLHSLHSEDKAVQYFQQTTSLCK